VSVAFTLFILSKPGCSRSTAGSSIASAADFLHRRLRSSPHRLDRAAFVTNLTQLYAAYAVAGSDPHWSTTAEASAQL